ncbi:Decaprenyl diphosphate synthase-like protein [Lipomyces tetrasporus]|uniref:ditrans,polycis-polyprenyl diphosphate synthase [(2E,6E)-farnesyldiphosphate specific] n=1 Tax=Lipomyces tetrasporus TaxID=54092 RepID=A0AAD7QY09_9ASCO|nr:Decaprenyl diphosphate synthase-like protein [Lipomyces tetrasporus]KAJ8103338.1 Decaprenyl diphosphate synthase-like protein [Lipomyces tetrasporus]
MSPAATMSSPFPEQPIGHFKLRPQPSQLPAVSSPSSKQSSEMGAKRTKIRARLVTRVKDFLVVNLVPLGTSPAYKPTNLFQLAIFHIYHTVLIFLHILLSIYYLFARQYYIAKNNFLAFLYHHHRTPQLIAQDIKGLAKTPQHVGIILKYKENEEGGGVEGLMEQVADVASWSVGACVKTLTVYERTGTLNKMHEATYKVINRTLKSYYGETFPAVKLRTPHDKTVYPEAMAAEPDLNISFISHDDGRGFLVELTREFAYKAAKGEFDPSKVTVDNVDRLANQLVITEPDLIVLFGSKPDLDGFPPWQVRLSEIYYAPHNNSVTYNVFLRGIRRYSKCKINIGR